MRSSSRSALAERGLRALALALALSAGLAGVATLVLAVLDDDDAEARSAAADDDDDEADGVGEERFVRRRLRGISASSSALVNGAWPPSLPRRSLHDVDRCLRRTSGRAKLLPHAGQMQLGELSAKCQRGVA